MLRRAWRPQATGHRFLRPSAQNAALVAVLRVFLPNALNKCLVHQRNAFFRFQFAFSSGRFRFSRRTRFHCLQAFEFGENLAFDTFTAAQVRNPACLYATPGF